MIAFMEKPKENSQDSGAGKCVDSQLWHACAGAMVQMPPANSEVFYFPQGHSEHASASVDFRTLGRVPPCVPCRVTGVSFMADPDTDEVFAKIRLVPASRTSSEPGPVEPDNREKPASFAKTLTQSDANNGGGFSVPRYCAETIFPRLDYSSEPPVQTVLAKDVHGETWKFRHIYRGTPRRHLLTTGWSTFVNHKKLVAGDSIVFMRAESGELCVGIRRAKRGIGGGPEMQMGWNYAGFYRVDPEVSKRMKNEGSGRVRGEDVILAAGLAGSGRAFEVVFYPRASTPEFCVRADLVRAAMRIRWCSGMRFKMAFETEDSSRVSWFMGTVSSAQVEDPIQWPDSPWRLLQVAWDEPDLLHNVKRVSPWLVELVSNVPAIHFSPFNLPRKKLRLPETRESPLEIPLGSFSGNPFGYNPNNNSNPAGMQGARHGLYGLSSRPNNSFPVGFIPPSPITPKPGCTENVSCQLTMGGPIQSRGLEKSDNGKAPFMLFGQRILTERQMISMRCSSDNTMNSSSDGSGAGHTPGGVTEVERVGDKLFGDIAKTTRRLTIVADDSSNEDVGSIDS